MPLGGAFYRAGIGGLASPLSAGQMALFDPLHNGFSSDATYLAGGLIATEQFYSFQNWIKHNIYLVLKVTLCQGLKVTCLISKMERMVTSRSEKELLEFSARLNEALDLAGAPPKHHGRQRYVAKLFKVSQKGARKWLEGEAFPALWRIKEIAQELNVRAEWLLTGQGPKEDDRRKPELTPKQAILLNHFEALTEGQQGELLRELEETKQRNEALFEELSRKKAEREAKV
jgi:transcriptional regulator with XRE-family HTH domain